MIESIKQSIVVMQISKVSGATFRSLLKLEVKFVEKQKRHIVIGKEYLKKKPRAQQVSFLTPTQSPFVVSWSSFWGAWCFRPIILNFFDSSFSVIFCKEFPVVVIESEGKPKAEKWDSFVDWKSMLDVRLPFAVVPWHHCPRRGVVMPTLKLFCEIQRFSKRNITRKWSVFEASHPRDPRFVLLVEDRRKFLLIVCWSSRVEEAAFAENLVWCAGPPEFTFPYFFATDRHGRNCKTRNCH